jgi:hypothetical protein
MLGRGAFYTIHIHECYATGYWERDNTQEIYITSA